MGSARAHNQRGGEEQASRDPSGPGATRNPRAGAHTFPWGGRSNPRASLFQLGLPWEVVSIAWVAPAYTFRVLSRVRWPRIEVAWITMPTMKSPISTSSSMVGSS
jgi:hypothetical protein